MILTGVVTEAAHCTQDVEDKVVFIEGVAFVLAVQVAGFVAQSPYGGLCGTTTAEL